VKRLRIILAVVALIIAVIAFTIGRPIYRIRSFDAAHAKITRETNEAAVVDLMGPPERVETSVSIAFWDDATLGDDAARQVVKQYWYTVNLPPVPISWTIGFDANGRVISKHRWD
jgi:hypothetical protein